MSTKRKLRAEASDSDRIITAATIASISRNAMFRALVPATSTKVMLLASTVSTTKPGTPIFRLSTRLRRYPRRNRAKGTGSVCSVHARHAQKSAATAGRMNSRDAVYRGRSEEHTSELQSRFDLVCRLLLEKKKRGDE